MTDFQISGNLVDIINKQIFEATIEIQNGKITKIEKESGKNYKNYILPGFVDSHIHIESSMLVPSEFASMAVVHGTVATVSDPHEISNVLGVPGIDFMIENGKQTPFKFYFGAPSCVPATSFETAGATVSAEDIRELLSRDDIKYLSEMMNYPGVLNEFPDVMEKIKIAKEFGKPIDGHAPGLMGDDGKRYIEAGISTDHECFMLDEALNKISHGMKISIREGSAAKNFYELHSLIETHPEMVMFCSDDKHPDDLAEGHINEIVKRAISFGHDLFDVLRCTILNPIEHYKLDVGMLRVGDPADFVVIDNLKYFNILKTYINGKLVAENGKSLIDAVAIKTINNFKTGKKHSDDFIIKAQSGKLRVIEAINGQLITNEIITSEKSEDGFAISDIENDILKITVVNRYEDVNPAVAFIKNFGLKRGAIASSVAHDSHNIIAVGVLDEDICNAVNAVIQNKGGLSVADGNSIDTLPLPVAGLMAIGDGYAVGEKYRYLSQKVKELGSQLHSPFMTLSFMALTVIPQLKLSDLGLFGGNKFEFVDLHL